ncbi:MAG TPA: SDR family oxidoreductase [Candidatus Binataceae bacterium]|nr:SDR family oxidoreductase [Candidatus Binataceae bacterium]
MATALITGASSGIGESFSYALARQNYDLVLVARRQDRLNTVADKAKKLGAKRAEVIASDISRPGAPLELQANLARLPIEIDCLINNAGFGTTGRFDQLRLERELEEIQLNVNALVALTRLFLPAMIERHNGAIINVASTAAFQPIPYMATYAATKAFVLNFTEAIAVETRDTGVRILALCPGPVRTEFQAVAKNQRARVPSFAYLDANTVVSQALAAVARGRRVRINGMMNAAGAFAARVFPRSLVTAVAGRIYRNAGIDG